VAVWPRQDGQFRLVRCLPVAAFVFQVLFEHLSPRRWGSQVDHASTSARIAAHFITGRQCSCLPVGRRLHEQLSEALRAQACVTCTVLGISQHTTSCGMASCGFLRGLSDPGAGWTESFVESKWPVPVSDETVRAIRSSCVRRWRPQTLPKVKSSAGSARSGSAFGLVNVATG
jgi:hypothetical protein